MLYGISLCSKTIFFFQVLIVDPSKKESKTLLKLAESFYVHTAPLRLGIVFAVPDDNTKTGLDDAAVAALNAFNYVSEVKDAYGGLSFITDVSCASGAWNI